jgi:hypothetical protein
MKTRLVCGRFACGSLTALRFDALRRYVCHRIDQISVFVSVRGQANILTGRFVCSERRERDSCVRHEATRE